MLVPVVDPLSLIVVNGTPLMNKVYVWGRSVGTGRWKLYTPVSTLVLLIMSIELRDGGKRKIIPFIQTPLTQSATVNPKGSTLHVYNMCRCFSVLSVCSTDVKGQTVEVGTDPALLDFLRRPWTTSTLGLSSPLSLMSFPPKLRWTSDWSGVSYRCLSQVFLLLLWNDKARDK